MGATSPAPAAFFHPARARFASRGCSNAGRARTVWYGLQLGWLRSLALPFVPVRTASTFEHQGPAIRLHIGLEDPDDLIADLEAGFARLKAHS